MKLEELIRCGEYGGDYTILADSLEERKVVEKILNDNGLKPRVKIDQFDIAIMRIMVYNSEYYDLFVLDIPTVTITAADFIASNS